jgi:electron transfer flavoprotein alpha subunit
MNRAIWAYSENETISNEIASAAVDVARGASAEPVVLEIAAIRQGTKASGAKLLIKGPESPDSPPEVMAEAMARAAKQLQPAAVLIGATRNGREVASRLAAKLKIGCLSETSKLNSDGKSMTGERRVYAGKATATINCVLPAVATVRVGYYPRIESAPKTTMETDVGKIPALVKLVSRQTKAMGTVDLKSAKIIVSAGRGVKKKEDLLMIEELAKEMHGALGCSRPLSSDLGWLPEEHHIGLTGITVKPDLYLAVGISGQLQHTAGMKDSKIVAAINTDKEAPIFQASDYGIVGDLYQVVPAIKKALAARR